MIGIIGAMEDEVRLLRDAMETPSVTRIGAFEFYEGKLEGKSVVLLRCGIGKVTAAVGCALLIHTFKPQFVINTGSAGGIDPALHFGDVIISTGLVYHDVDVTAFNYAPGQLPDQPQIFPADEKLIAKAEQAVAQLKQQKILPAALNYCRGLIGTGDTFMHQPERLPGPYRNRRHFYAPAGKHRRGAPKVPERRRRRNGRGRHCPLLPFVLRSRAGYPRPFRHCRH